MEARSALPRTGAVPVREGLALIDLRTVRDRVGEVWAPPREIRPYAARRAQRLEPAVFFASMWRSRATCACTNAISSAVGAMSSGSSRSFARWAKHFMTIASRRLTSATRRWPKGPSSRRRVRKSGGKTSRYAAALSFSQWSGIPSWTATLRSASRSVPKSGVCFDQIPILGDAPQLVLQHDLHAAGEDESRIGSAVPAKRCQGAVNVVG